MAILKYQWVRVAALDRLLLGLADNRNPSLTGTLVLPITRYDISDPSFVELAFSSSALDLDGTIFVPRAEVSKNRLFVRLPWRTWPRRQSARTV